MAYISSIVKTMCRTLGLVLVLPLCCISTEYEPHCLMIDHLTQTNVYLNGGSYLAISAASLLDCATECGGRQLCMSFGFDSETRSCHLHTTNSSQRSLIAKENWSHGDMVDWQKKILGLCTGHRCSLDEQCQLNRGGTVPVCIRGPFVHLVTPRNTKEEFKPIPDQTMRELIGNTSSLKFLVKTCHDANLELTERSPSSGDHIYRVVIGGGGNTGTFFLDKNTPEAGVSISTPSILDCDRFLPFWLDWSDRKLSLGTGTSIKRNVLVEKPMFRRLEVTRISLSSYINNNGTWLFFVQGINQ